VTDQTSETRTEHPVRASINGSPRVPATLFVYTRTTWLTSPFPSTDPTWSVIDGAGHWHGFTEGSGLLPTLDRDGEVTWCRQCTDDDCSGYRLPAYTCKICAEPIHPKFGPPVAEATAIPTAGGWTAAVDYDLEPDPVRVQARFWLPDGGVLVGIASRSKPGTLTGVGELATVGAAARRPLAFHQISQPA
jgi:hypothetical protein